MKVGFRRCLGRQTTNRLRALRTRDNGDLLPTRTRCTGILINDVGPDTGDTNDDDGNDADDMVINNGPKMRGAHGLAVRFPLVHRSGPSYD